MVVLRLDQEQKLGAVPLSLSSLPSGPLPNCTGPSALFSPTLLTGSSFLSLFKFTALGPVLLHTNFSLSLTHPSKVPVKPDPHKSLNCLYICIHLLSFVYSCPVQLLQTWNTCHLQPKTSLSNKDIPFSLSLRFTSLTSNGQATSSHDR